MKQILIHAGEQACFPRSDEFCGSTNEKILYVALIFITNTLPHNVISISVENSVLWRPETCYLNAGRSQMQSLIDVEGVSRTNSEKKFPECF